jgi:hypothetical protein
VIFLGDFSFVKIFLKNYCVTMTTTLNTSRSENTMVLSARVSACMYFLVIIIRAKLLIKIVIYKVGNHFFKEEEALKVCHELEGVTSS